MPALICGIGTCVICVVSFTVLKIALLNCEVAVMAVVSNALVLPAAIPTRTTRWQPAFTFRVQVVPLGKEIVVLGVFDFAVSTNVSEPLPVFVI